MLNTLSCKKEYILNRFSLSYRLIVVDQQIDGLIDLIVLMVRSFDGSIFQHVSFQILGDVVYVTNHVVVSSHIERTIYSTPFPLEQCYI